ncbi:cytochrome P450 703A2 isoform X1 [Selaginella moellendorffii]|nr:cytochrome P450 703A2 isoform X1 [Selaginella moellendorffii]|eukprot:XP_024531366.1 cytochrome P450 703A2 isoform X1 [Selaginella moellendorffii]
MSTVVDFLSSAQGWNAACMVAAALVCVVSVMLGRKENRNLPPGPPGWPIIGNLMQLGPLPHRTMAGWCQKYGPLVYCRLGSTPTITASSPQMIRELLWTQDETFASRPRTTAGKLMAYHDQNVGLAPYDAHWKLMRRICVEHLLTTRRMEGFQKSRAEEARDLVQIMFKEAKAENTINMREHLGGYTMNVVTRMLIGKRYFGTESMGEKEATDFRELIHAAIVLHGVFYIPDHVPLLKWIDPNGYRRLFKKMGTRMDDYYSYIVEEHRKRQRNGEVVDGPKDFVDVLLGLAGENSELHLNDVEIKALIQDMVVGGTDTASFTMEWFMLEMIRNPKVMRKVQAELDSVLQKKATNKHLLEESDLASLDYLRAAVKETFRIHPVGGFLIPHESIRDTKVAGYHVPKGSLILINTHGLGRNAAVWDNVDEFRPERFLRPEDKVHLRDSEYRVIPFGSGKRACPGAQLGQSMLLLGLGRLLHGFDWFPPPGTSREDIDVMEAYGLTTPPRTPLRAVAKARLDQSFYSFH